MESDVPTKNDITKKELEQLNTKMDLGNIVDNRDAFYQENEQFQGKEVEITFQLEYEGDLNGQKFSDTFKEGQDFEFVKYKLSQVLEVNPEQIDLYHKGKIIIPVFSICDIELGSEDIITIKIKPE